jgi:MFS family permease
LARASALLLEAGPARSRFHSGEFQRFFAGVSTSSKESAAVAGAIDESLLATKGWAGFVAKFSVLKGAQRELWLTFLIKFFIYTAYSVTKQDYGSVAFEGLGFSDQAAGALVGWVWAPAMTVFTLLAGSVTDAIGLRRTFFLGVIICTIARSVMVVTTMPALALACGVLPLAVGEALGTPVLLAATRCYSTTQQRSIAFSIIYAIMNVGYWVAGWVFDFVRRNDFHPTFFGFAPTTHQQLFLVSLALEIVLFPTIYFLRRREESERQTRSTFLWPGAGKWRRDHPPLSSTARTISFLPLARLLSSHRLSESHLSANGLCLSEIRRSRVGAACPSG